jgi:type IV secretory pathway TrbD component
VKIYKLVRFLSDKSIHQRGARKSWIMVNGTLAYYNIIIIVLQDWLFILLRFTENDQVRLIMPRIHSSS